MKAAVILVENYNDPIQLYLKTFEMFFAIFEILKCFI